MVKQSRKALPKTQSIFKIYFQKTLAADFITHQFLLCWDCTPNLSGANSWPCVAFFLDARNYSNTTDIKISGGCSLVDEYMIMDFIVFL